MWLISDLIFKSVKSPDNVYEWLNWNFDIM